MTKPRLLSKRFNYKYIRFIENQLLLFGSGGGEAYRQERLPLQLFPAIHSIGRIVWRIVVGVRDIWLRGRMKRHIVVGGRDVWLRGRWPDIVIPKHHLVGRRRWVVVDLLAPKYHLLVGRRRWVVVDLLIACWLRRNRGRLIVVLMIDCRRRKRTRQEWRIVLKGRRNCGWWRLIVVLMIGPEGTKLRCVGVFAGASMVDCACAGRRRRGCWCTSRSSSSGIDRGR